MESTPLKMRIITSLFLLLSQVLLLSCQKEGVKNSLLVIQRKTDQLQCLISYNFTNGKHLSTDTLISSIDVGHLSYLTDHSTLYKNRYVILPNGSIIDVKNKAVLKGERHDFLEAVGDSLIFSRNYFYTRNYFLADLKNWDYRPIKDKSFYATKGLHSPNHLWGIETQQTEHSKKIVLYDKNNNQETTVSDCGNGTFLSMASSDDQRVPLHWVDNEHFIYAKYGDTAYGDSIDDWMINITINKVNIHTKVAETVIKIDSVSPASSSDQFSSNPKGDIFFYCQKGRYKIDLDTKQAIKQEYWDCKNGFAIKGNSESNFVRDITHQGQEIGQFQFTSYHTATTNNLFAIGHVKDHLFLQNQENVSRGIKIWNAYTQQWIDFPVTHSTLLLGWIEQ